MPNSAPLRRRLISLGCRAAQNLAKFVYERNESGVGDSSNDLVSAPSPPIVRAYRDEMRVG